MMRSPSIKKLIDEHPDFRRSLFQVLRGRWHIRTSTIDRMQAPDWNEKGRQLAAEALGALPDADRGHFTGCQNEYGHENPWISDYQQLTAFRRAGAAARGKTTSGWRVTFVKVA